MGEVPLSTPIRQLLFFFLETNSKFKEVSLGKNTAKHHP